MCALAIVRLILIVVQDTGAGLRAVDQIAERLGLDGVYGPLYRLFEVTDDKFNTAIELTAGNSLFHVVVDNDETATTVLQTMLREKTGRVTFMPLNRLHPKLPPTPDAQDAIPLLSKLRYDSAHARAFEQVFGKTCVCRDLTIAAAYVKSHGINTITLDGDKVDRKGALTGGWYDVRRSRLEAVRAVTSWRAKYEVDEKRLREVTQAIQKTEQDITRLVGQIQVKTNQQVAARSTRETLVEESANYTRERERLVQRIERLEGEALELESELANLERKVHAYREEMAGPLATNLSEEEEEEIENFGREVEQRQRQVLEYAKTKNEVRRHRIAMVKMSSLSVSAWEAEEHA